MAIDLNEYRLKKVSKLMNEISKSTKQGSIAFAEACYALAYKAREYASKIETNEKELNKGRNNK